MQLEYFTSELRQADLQFAVVTTAAYAITSICLRLHCAIYRPDSSLLVLRYCANVKVIRHESTSL